MLDKYCFLMWKGECSEAYAVNYVCMVRRAEKIWKFVGLVFGFLITCSGDYQNWMNVSIK